MRISSAVQHPTQLQKVLHRPDRGRCINDRLREHAEALNGSVGGRLPAHCKKCGCTLLLEKCGVLGCYREQKARKIYEVFCISQRGEVCISPPDISLIKKGIHYLRTWHVSPVTIAVHFLATNLVLLSLVPSPLPLLLSFLFFVVDQHVSRCNKFFVSKRFCFSSSRRPVRCAALYSQIYVPTSSSFNSSEVNWMFLQSTADYMAY